MADYTLRELMTIAAAREIPDGAITFCGTGISMVAAMAAFSFAVRCRSFQQPAERDASRDWHAGGSDSGSGLYQAAA